MVPVYHLDETDPESHGHLQAVWLGGLVSPYALITALRHERAVVARCSVEDVSFNFSIKLKHFYFYLMFNNIYVNLLTCRTYSQVLAHKQDLL